MKKQFKSKLIKRVSNSMRRPAVIFATLMSLTLLQPGFCHAQVNRVSVVSIFVTDFERAKAWYTEKLGFSLVEDSMFGPDPTDRWITVRAKGDPSLRLLFRLGTPVGRQRNHPDLPEIIFDTITHDLMRTAAELKAKGVKFVREPTHYPWGFEALIIDQDGQGIAIAESK